MDPFQGFRNPQCAVDTKLARENEMPWEKQFDVKETLTKAMEAFWSRGFVATSMQDLVDTMGINRASIYSTYGDKRALFMQSLNHYDETYRCALLNQIRIENTPRNAIMALFEGVVHETLMNGNRTGCLLVNTALELAPPDEEIAGVVARALEETEDFFEGLVERAQELGEVSASVDPVETARGLLNLLLALRVLSRSRPEEAALRAVVRQAEDLLG